MAVNILKSLGHFRRVFTVMTTKRFGHLETLKSRSNAWMDIIE